MLAPMSDTSDVIVVGGGIFGATAALALRRRGHRVTLVDPGPLPHPDASSTDISKVIRADYGPDVFYTEQMEAALPLWRAWNEAWPWPRPLFHETGFVLLTEGPMAEGSFEASSHRVLTSRGHALERLDAAALRARFPAFDASVYTDGYYNPSGGWAESGRVVAAVLEGAREAGVELREGEPVVELLSEGERVIGIRTEKSELTAGHTVIAAGAWTAGLVPELERALRVVGQPVLHFAPADLAPFTPPRFVPFGADISRTGWYGFCANAEGLVKLAHHGRGEAIDPRAPRHVPAGAEARFRAFLARSIPALADAPKVADRLCLYCDSLDGDLFIDRHPSREGLVVAAGGSGHAFKLAPLLGDWIADAVEGTAVVERFAWRTADTPRFEAARFVE
jgi:glycine/D-amino acid oxidase-like deaminating enzyme